MAEANGEQTQQSSIVTAIRKAEANFTKHLGTDEVVGPTGMRASVLASKDKKTGGKGFNQQQAEHEAALLKKAREAVKDAA